MNEEASTVLIRMRQLINGLETEGFSHRTIAAAIIWEAFRLWARDLSPEDAKEKLGELMEISKIGIGPLS